MFYLLIVTVVVLLIACLIASTRKPPNFPPGPYWLPLVGSLPTFKELSKALGGQHLALKKLSEDYKSNVIGLKLGGDYVIAVSSHRLVRAVLTSEEYDGRPINFFMKLRSMGTGKGVTGTDGEHWKIQRNFVNVHLRNLGFGKKTMEHQVQEEVSEILQILKDTGEHKAIQIATILSISVLNILWRLMSGSRMDRNDGRLTKLLDLFNQRAKAFDMAGGTLNQLPWLRHIAPEKTGYNLIMSLNDQLRGMLMETIQEHFQSWTEDRCDDLIYAFITEMKKNEGRETTFTEAQLVMVCLDLFLAGAQTTSNTLDFAFLLMILHPDVKKKVQDCLDGAFDDSEEINYSERSRVPYVEAVLQEVERFCHIAPIIGPRRVFNDTTLDGYRIPKNATVLISVYSVHNDQEYWNDPQIFKPERFLDEHEKLISHDRFLPFGYGKRRCLGEILAKQCIFSFFSAIMRGYDITLPAGASKPTGIPHPGITLTPEKYTAVFTNRKSFCSHET